MRRPRPGNVAEATNFGLREARGDYIAILDDDDYWATPDKLHRQLEFLERNPEYVACGGGAIVVDLAGRERLRYLKPETDSAIRRRALYANPVVHSSAVYRRQAALEAGGYDESLAGFADWDFWLRLGQRGKLYNLQEYLVYYQLWEGGGSFWAQRANTRSGLRIVWRHRSAYPGAPIALALALGYWTFARLPLPVRRLFYERLSLLKKALFAGRR
ncbi:MAG: glycosyltransferase [Bryobacteraceae bacterium]